MKYERAPPSARKRVPWKNGLGITEELLVHPPGAGTDGPPFLWRLSVASIERDCPFSAFPGYTRTIMLIEGAGMTLSVAGKATLLDRRFEPFVFSGDEPAECVLAGGAVRDLNLMVDRARLTSTLEVVPPLAHVERELTSCTWLLMGLEAPVRLKIDEADLILAAGEVIRVDTTHEATTVAADSAGATLVATLVPVGE